MPWKPLLYSSITAGAGGFLVAWLHALFSKKYALYRIQEVSYSNKFWLQVLSIFCISLVLTLYSPLKPYIWFPLLPLLWLVFLFDLEYQLIPDRLSSAIFIAAGLAAAHSMPSLDIYTNLIWGVAGSLSLWLLTLCYEKLRQRPGLGLGDVKLLFALSPLQGSILLQLLLSACLLSAIVISIQKLRQRETAAVFAFAPYILLASLLHFIFA